MKNRNLAKGIFLVAIALAFGLQALRYPIGALGRAGPGLFPLLVSSLLLLIGVAIVVRALLTERPAPLMLGFILGPMLEENFRRALLLSRGSFTTFVTRPISGTLLALIAIFIVWQLLAFLVQTLRTSAPRQQSA